jgi:ornithine--oxo-acid transaminase
MTSFLSEQIQQHIGQNFELHEKHLNKQMVKVLKTIGFDRTYIKAKGPYLYISMIQKGQNIWISLVDLVSMP